MSSKSKFRRKKVDTKAQKLKKADELLLPFQSEIIALNNLKKTDIQVLGQIHEDTQAKMDDLKERILKAQQDYESKNRPAPNNSRRV